MDLEKIIVFDYDKYIKINDDLLEKFIVFFEKEIVNFQREPYNWVDNIYWISPSLGPEINSQYFTLGNSINFKYWKIYNSKVVHARGKKGGIMCRGAYYMWRCLKVCIETINYPILDASYLMHINMEDIRNIFKTDDGYNIIPCMKERWLNWRNLGRILVEKYDGNFYNLIYSVNNSIKKFIKFSKEFRAFDDPLCKLTMVNAIFHQGRKIVNFKGEIFPAVDYQLITQVIRIGLIEIEKDLKQKIEKREFISKIESLALRKATLKCLQIISNKVGISGDIIDNIFFLNGRLNCTYNLICQKKSGVCKFEKICEKKLKFYMPLEKTRYY